MSSFSSCEMRMTSKTLSILTYIYLIMHADLQAIAYITITKKKEMAIPAYDVAANQKVLNCLRLLTVARSV